MEAKIKGCIGGSCEKESFYKWVEDILSSINGVDAQEVFVFNKKCWCFMRNARVFMANKNVNYHVKQLTKMK